MRKVVIILSFLSFLWATETRTNTITQNYLNFGNANYLLDDEYIIQIYPSILFSFPNHVSISAHRNNYAYGSGFLRNNTLGFGAFISRNISFTYKYDNFSDNITFNPIDLVLGLKVSKISFGINFRYSNFSLDTFQFQSASRTINNFLSILPSVSFDFLEKFKINLSFEILNNDYSNQKTNNFYSAKNNLNGFFGRFIYNQTFIVPIVYQTSSYFLNAPVGGRDPDFENNQSLIRIGFGLNKKIMDYGFGIISFTYTQMSDKNSDNNINEINESSFQGFGILSGGEFKFLSESIKLRGSISYDIGRVFQSKIKPPETNINSSRIGFFGDIAFGIGWSSSVFNIDIDFTRDLFYKGPQFISGNNLGFNMSIIAKF